MTVGPNPVDVALPGGVSRLPGSTLMALGHTDRVWWVNSPRLCLFICAQSDNMPGGAKAIQPTLGVFNEDALRRLDLAVAACKVVMGTIGELHVPAFSCVAG